MANRKYIHWQDPGVEKIPPNEAEDIQAVADQINAIQKAQWNMHRHCYSGTVSTYNGEGASLIGFRHSCSHARHRQGHAHCQGRPPEASEAEHVCRSWRISNSVPLQQRARRPRLGCRSQSISTCQNKANHALGPHSPATRFRHEGF